MCILSPAQHQDTIPATTTQTKYLSQLYGRRTTSGFAACVTQTYPFQVSQTLAKIDYKSFNPSGQACPQSDEIITFGSLVLGCTYGHRLHVYQVRRYIQEPVPESRPPFSPFGPDISIADFILPCSRCDLGLFWYTYSPVY